MLNVNRRKEKKRMYENIIFSQWLYSKHISCPNLMTSSLENSLFNISDQICLHYMILVSQSDFIAFTLLCLPNKYSKNMNSWDISIVTACLTGWIQVDMDTFYNWNDWEKVSHSPLNTVSKSHSSDTKARLWYCTWQHNELIICCLPTECSLTFRCTQAIIHIYCRCRDLM